MRLRKLVATKMWGHVGPSASQCRITAARSARPSTCAEGRGEAVEPQVPRAPLSSCQASPASHCFFSTHTPLFFSRGAAAPSCSLALLHSPLLRSSTASPLTVLVPFPNSSIRTSDRSVALFTAFATCWVPGGQGTVSETFEACNALTTVCLAVKLLVCVCVHPTGLQVL